MFGGAGVLRLEPLAGPTLRVIQLEPNSKPAGSAWVLGRSTQSDVTMHDPEGVVSRSHCSVQVQGGGWSIKDLGSRHGTYVNGAKLAAQTPILLQDGDRVRIGPWTLRASLGGGFKTTRLQATSDDRHASTMTMVRKLGVESVGVEAKRRLDLIIQCAGDVGRAETETQIATIALEAVSKGTGFPRAAVLRLAGQGEHVEVLASIQPSGAGKGPDSRFSLSLLQAASEGQPVLLNSADRPNYGQSVMNLDISAAVCCPVVIDGQPDAYLYVDVRGGEVRLEVGGIRGEVAAYCDAIARLVALAFANLQRKRLERDEERQKLELEAAREVQKLIMPPIHGNVGRLRYHVRSIPGRYVAGDLFDFIPIDEGRAAVLLGDVAGKGVAAGMVMANVQGHLHRLLRTTCDPHASLAEANRIVCEYGGRASRVLSTIFLSVWAGVFDERTGVLRYIDAGHGFCLVRRPGERPAPPARGQVGGALGLGEALPIGVDPGFEVTPGELRLEPGTRVYLYSDGVVEQLNANNEQFGNERVRDVLTGHADATEEVDRLVDAVRAHAGLPDADEQAFADDFTVAVLEMT